ncbi:hypothetical protein [Nocardioides soli]|uniref:Integral membrane protein n=1 Tax=Nocardioides soli TaxID=1036020 RepID=A0A7W4Z403_9ACTN|nr:hypothetical protein [Nocardioides soli]MBB3045557.1 hypothetical protein [Nocardioides soli]MBB3045618.1 hypothetical protein [Nocardioides soli]
MAEEKSSSEVEELRAEVERLRAEMGGPPPTAELPVEGHGRTGWWRPVVATVLIILMAVLAPLSVVARWAHDTVSDTDRYVETVQPLASDPAVQAAVIDRITNEIVTRLQIDSVTDRAVDALASRGLPPLAESSLRALSGPLAGAIDGFVKEQVTSLVESDEFETAWVEANRQAHTQLVAVLTGKDTDQVQITNNAVSINLATLIDTVKQRLVDRGFALAGQLPTINAQFTIFQSDDITKAQTAFRLLGAINTWLPIIALLCLAGAVAVGRSRRRTLVAGALALALSMLLLGAALNLSREIYLNAVPTDQLPTEAAAAIYDTLVHFIRLSLRALLVVALAVAFIAWLTGPEGAPAALRRGTSRAIGAVRQGGDRVGLDTGRFGIALHTYKTPIRIAVLGGALLIYVLRDHPTGGFAIGLLVVAAIILLLVELLSRPPAPAGDGTAAPPAPPTPS